MKKSLFGLLLLLCFVASYVPLVLADDTEDDIFFAYDDELIDYSEVKSAPIIYTEPPAPPALPKKKEDPTVTAYRDMAKGLKSITYDKLPAPIKKNFDSVFMSVYSPIATHFKENVTFESLDFKRIPEFSVPGEKEHAFLIIANLTLYNQAVRAILREMSFAEGKPRYSMTLEFTKGVQLSDLAKELKIIDLDVQKLQLVFSDWKYEDKEQGIVIEKGLNLVGDVQMTGMLNGIKHLTKLEQLRMYGTIKKEFVGSTLYGVIPAELSFGGGSKLTKMIVGVDIKGKGPLDTPVAQFMLRGNLSMSIKGLADPLIFTSELNLGIDGAELSGSIEGTWENPFGLKGFSIGDVGVGASVFYAAGAPKGFTLKGTMDVGNKKFALATKVSATDGAAFIGKMDGTLSYKDLVVFANKVTHLGLSAEQVDSVFNVIPNVEIEDPVIHFVPVTTTIFGKSYPQSTTFEGAIKLLGKKTTMSITLFKDGIKGSATLPEIQIPLYPEVVNRNNRLVNRNYQPMYKENPILFTLKGMEDKELPKVILAINSQGAEFYAKGIIELMPFFLGGGKGEGFVDFTALGTNIKLKSKLFDQFMFDIDLKSKMSFSQPPTNIMVKATMSADGGIGDLTDRLKKSIFSVLGDPKSLQNVANEKTRACFADKFPEKFKSGENIPKKSGSGRSKGSRS